MSKSFLNGGVLIVALSGFLASTGHARDFDDRTVEFPRDRGVFPGENSNPSGFFIPDETVTITGSRPPGMVIDGSGIANEMRRQNDLAGKRGDLGGGSSIVRNPKQEDEERKLTLTLTQEDIDVLKWIAKQERKASSAKGILTFGPLASLFDKDPISFTFTVLTTDWSSHAAGIGDVNKIKSGQISLRLSLHMEQMSGDKLEFFKGIYDTYAKDL
ncbi:MAG: hypothetical protein N4A53_02870 [Pelagimonas sp.]|jgi:hypothetical protein|nr:hypothetical protein [Pelagimonas sp.]